MPPKWAVFVRWFGAGGSMAAKTRHHLAGTLHAFLFVEWAGKGAPSKGTGPQQDRNNIAVGCRALSGQR